MQFIFAIVGLVPGLVLFLTLFGLAADRGASSDLAFAAGAFMTWAPPLIAAFATRREFRLGVLGLAQILWGGAVLLILPIYFPGERTDALARGIASLGQPEPIQNLGRDLVDQLPEVAVQTRPPVPEAPPLPDPVRPASNERLADTQIALPYEGEGRRLAVPVAFEHDGKTIEVEMMLDTGATYTTLGYDTLAQLGIFLDDNAPQLNLHTANGERQAQVALLDTVWLGDLAIEGVSVATCDVCATDTSSGLLGLNVLGGFNVTIDADYREVIFTTREVHDRHLDVKPYTELGASYTRLPGGRVDVEVEFTNHSPRRVIAADVTVACSEDLRWQIHIPDIESGVTVTRTRRLPRHATCDGYTFALEGARW